MTAASPLCASLHAKIDEQIERTQHLLALIPPESGSWTPPVAGAWPVDFLLGHLLECLAGFCAVLVAAEPERLAHFGELRGQPVNHACSPAEAAARIVRYRTHIAEGFTVLRDED